MSLPAYRALIRSAKIAFKNDTTTLMSALQASRGEFEANRDASSKDAAAQVKHANEVAEFLRRNLVQGKKATPDADLYSAFCSTAAAAPPPLPERLNGR